MRISLFGFMGMFAFLFSLPSFAQETEKSQTKFFFFTKQDASNWVYVLKDKNVDPSDVFRMRDGTLQITGVSTGYLRTRKSYSNYELSTEWRWTETLANSGVLVHIQPNDVVWPVCYQVQQKAGDAGDIICMNGLWAKECTDSVKFTVKKMQSSNEKPLGEWNSMKVICNGKTLKVFINGILQNNITGLTASSGFIGFQNEGKPIEFRKLLITLSARYKKL
ncbi:MAG: DUF1080 domain-containing protein [Bacteroidota bacterium]|nr:DUF1080 domain-containing protein [Bacteroidota bacterium]